MDALFGLPPDTVVPEDGIVCLDNGIYKDLVPRNSRCCQLDVCELAARRERHASAGVGAAHSRAQERLDLVESSVRALISTAAMHIFR